jgi:hypothetical protein
LKANVPSLDLDFVTVEREAKRAHPGITIQIFV